jgi:hypothetical protein
MKHQQKLETYLVFLGVGEKKKRIISDKPIIFK